ncbi:MAG: hypothetical protein KGL35_11235 [Bradyrhizobium sp.]|nr:hypothetical protein [Bradyrhizobium sp.]
MKRLNLLAFGFACWSLGGFDPAPSSPPRWLLALGAVICFVNGLIVWYGLSDRENHHG